MHEAFHVDTGRAVAVNVLRQLSHLRAASREELERRFYLIRDQGYAWGKDEDLRFDLYTAHGPRL